MVCARGGRGRSRVPGSGEAVVAVKGPAYNVCMVDCMLGRANDF